MFPDPGVGEDDPNPYGTPYGPKTDWEGRGIKENPERGEEDPESEREEGEGESISSYFLLRGRIIELSPSPSLLDAAAAAIAAAAIAASAIEWVACESFPSSAPEAFGLLVGLCAKLYSLLKPDMSCGHTYLLLSIGSSPISRGTFWDGGRGTEEGGGKKTFGSEDVEVCV